VSYFVYSATHYKHNLLHSIGALLFSSMLNMCLNGMFLVQLTIFCDTLLSSEPVFIRVMVFMVSIFDISHTGMSLPFISHVLRGLHAYSPCCPAVMTYVALYACFGSHGKCSHICSLYTFHSRPTHRIANICMALLDDTIVEYTNICRRIRFVFIAPFYVVYQSHLAALGFYAFQYVLFLPVYVVHPQSM
jgi:hypothetical protein